MRLISSTILFTFLLSACTSDEVVKAQKKELFGIFKNYASESLSKNTPLSQSLLFLTPKMAKKFNQPIILTSSVDKKINQH